MLHLSIAQDQVVLPAFVVICITFVQYWPKVEDIWPTLYKCHTNVLCLLGIQLKVTKNKYKHLRNN